MTDHDTTTAKPERTWVWWCNEESIAAGKISALAIVETFAAVGLWWWLAMHFNWSIFSFVALFAAPMLLLRSEASIQKGVEMLRRYWDRDIGSASKAEKIAIYIATVLITSGLTFWLASQWLPMHTGWALFWRSAVLSAFVFVGAFASAVAIAGTGALTGVLAIYGTAMGAGAAASALKVFGAVSGAVTGAYTVAVLIWFVVAVAVVVIDTVAVSMFFPFIALGMLLRSQTIRLWATVVHLPEGISQLPRNWHETLWAIDLSHPPN